MVAGGYTVGTTIYSGAGMSFPVLTCNRITLTGTGTPAGNLTLTGDLQVTNRSPAAAMC